MAEYLPTPRRLPAQQSWGDQPSYSPAPPPGQGAPDTISFAQIYRVLRRHVGLVLAAAVLGLLGGFYLARQAPRVYRATAVVRLADSRRALTGGIEDAAPAKIGLYADPLHSLVQLMTGRQVARAVVDSLGLRLRSLTTDFPRSRMRDVRVAPEAASDSIFLTFYLNGLSASHGSEKVRVPYGSPVSLGIATFTVPAVPDVQTAVLKVIPREVAVDGLISQLKVVTRPNTDVVDVAYEDPSARIAQSVVNTMVQAFQASNILSAQDNARRRRVFLEGQLRETDSLLKIAQGELSQFRSAQHVASSGTQLVAEQEALIKISGDIGELTADRQTLAGLLVRLRSNDQGESSEGLRALAGMPGIGTNQMVASQFERLLLYQTRLDSLTTGPWSAAETNPDVVQLRSLIKGTKQNLVSAISSQVTSIDARIRSLQTRQATGGSSIQRLPSVAAEEMEMARKVETLSKNSDQQRQELQNARMAEVVEAGAVQVVNLADLPYMSVWAGGHTRLALGLIIGLLLGGFGAFFIERMNTSIRRPEDLDGMMPVPGLAVIPLIQENRKNKGRLAGLLGRGGTNGAKGTREGIGNLPQPLSIGTEAFRMLRTSLVWSESGESLKTIVVTSAAPGEGKTITAANLAVIFAHEGKRVLLVDCDVRRPKLHTMIRVPRSPGLVDLLRSDADMAELSAGTPPTESRIAMGDAEIPVPDYIRTTGIRGLYLLPCGRIEPTMADLASATRLRRLLADLSRWFDVVILDTPPVLAVADAGILGTMVDGVLLVVRAGQTDRTAVLRAHQHLVQIGARVVGTVFNDPEGEVTGEGGYYYPYDYAPQSE
ncbi:MAG TPA: polysaccharide biosynthesis tyrosine autokinase [Gemmatimonadales bacterium]|nr:polysaccharide biosynthesis tyrosine autokinase [Gemmatimonadales bacterium]